MRSNQFSPPTPPPSNSGANRKSDIVNRQSNPPPGFKPTKLGWLPEEWEVVRLKEVAKVQTGIAKGKKNEADLIELPYLRVANVQDGFLDLSEIKTIKLPTSKKARYALQVGDVLMTEGGDYDKLGRGTIWQGEVEDCLHQNHVFAVRANRARILPYYLSAYGGSDKGKIYFKSCSKQSTNLASINSTQLKSMPIPLPPLPEQHRIAHCLTTWDRAITTTRHLLDALRTRKRGLMQRLLTGEVRLPGFSENWSFSNFGKYFSERKETGFDDLQLLSIGQEGVYPQEQSSKKDTSNRNKSKYKRICPNDIGYNTMRMWQGRSALSETEGIVSPAYTILKPKKNANPEFFSYLFRTKPIVHKFFQYSQGLVSDTWQCRYKDFVKIRAGIPPLKEQTAIANVLTTADREIALYEQKLETLETQKRGLMQQLLTGQKRLPA